jgi:hypothetical protein
MDGGQLSQMPLYFLGNALSDKNAELNNDCMTCRIATLACFFVIDVSKKMRSGDELLYQKFILLVNDFSKNLTEMLPFLNSLDGVLHVHIASK